MVVVIVFFSDANKAKVQDNEKFDHRKLQKSYT